VILWPQPDGRVLATPQPAHALLAGQLMRALAEPPVPLEPVPLEPWPLEPWPLAVPRITLETETLHLPGRFVNAQAMRAGMADAPRERLVFELEAA